MNPLYREESRLHPIDLIEGALIGIASIVAALVIVLGAVW